MDGFFYEQLACPSLSSVARRVLSKLDRMKPLHRMASRYSLARPSGDWLVKGGGLHSQSSEGLSLLRLLDCSLVLAIGLIR